MDCGLCLAHLREKNRCAGCNGDDAAKPRHCVTCRIKTCEGMAGSTLGLCYECAKFPCARLRRLDARYRAKYGMSMVENLEYIREHGLERFIALEQTRRACPQSGSVLCMHSEACLFCGRVCVQS